MGSKRNNSSHSKCTVVQPVQKHTQNYKIIRSITETQTIRTTCDTENDVLHSPDSYQLTNSMELSPYWDPQTVQQLKNFSVIYETQMFTTDFTRALH
jgi:hypothetical protein